MNPDLIKTTQDFLYSKLYSKASFFLEEKSESIKNAIYYIIPITFAIINNECKSKRVATEIYNKITNAKFNNKDVKELEKVFDGKNSLILEEASHAIDVVFENEMLADLTFFIGKEFNIHNASVNSLFKMVLPYVFRVINNEIQSSSLGVYEFVELLKSQKNCCKHLSTDFLKKVSVNLNLELCESQSFIREIGKDYKKFDLKKKFAVVLLFLAAIGFGMFGSHFFFKKDESENKNIPTVNQPQKSFDENTSTDSVLNSKEVLNNTISNLNNFYNPTEKEVGKFLKGKEFLGSFIKRTLKNDQEIILLSKGGLNLFIDYLEQDGPVSKQAWFDLNRVKVIKEKGMIDTRKSEQILDDLVEVLKAYPNIKIKIGGLTDNEGPSLENFNLSHQFSEFAMKKLIKKGISQSRLDFEGYGENYPVLSNDTEDGRLFNQRISIRITSK